MPKLVETGSTPNFLSRKIETAANVATLVVAVLLSIVLVKNYLLPTSSAQRMVPVRTTEFAVVGTNLTKRLPGINWNKNGRTVVLVLSTHCHFCTESAPFFRQMRNSVGKDVKLIGVLPEPVAEAESYLNREGVQLDEVRRTSLDRVGVTGTPTMLLVNDKGTVMESWVGKLAPDKQNQVLKTILGGRSQGPRNEKAGQL